MPIPRKEGDAAQAWTPDALPGRLLTFLQSAPGGDYHSARECTADLLGIKLGFRLSFDADFLQKVELVGMILELLAAQGKVKKHVRAEVAGPVAYYARLDSAE